MNADNLTFAGKSGGDIPPANESDLVKETTTKDFRADVHRCLARCPGARRLLGALVRSLPPADARPREGGEREGGAIRLVKVNIDDHPPLAGQLGIQSIPAVFAFKNGHPLDGFMGAISEGQVTAFITRVGGPGDAGEPNVSAQSANEIHRAEDYHSPDANKNTPARDADNSPPEQRTAAVGAERLFICHASEDRSVAIGVVSQLEARGVRCWISSRDIRPGRPFDNEIVSAIEKCFAVLLLFSDRCNDKDYIRREITVAGEAGKLIIDYSLSN